MSKNIQIYLKDIIQAANKIENYTSEVDFAAFTANTEKQDAVIRNLEIIGEAVKKVPNDIKEKHSEIDWRKIAGLRDILVHDYSGVNLQIVWEIVIERIPTLKEKILRIMN